MNKKRLSKLSIHRETLRELDRSDLRTAAGATAQLGCGNTFNNSCKSCAIGCGTFLSCQTCTTCADSCHPNSCAEC